MVRYVRSIYEEIESSKLVEGKPQVEHAVLKKWKEASKNYEQLNQYLIDRSRFLAKLTQVDGALVMTERLSVLGFGVVVKDVSATRPTFRWCHDELCKKYEERKRDGYGTRHRSAMELCQEIDCVAFVLSQDGGVKALKREGDQVLVWPSVLLGPSAWFVAAEDIIPELREKYLGRSS
jgi:hypothetical protein